MDNLSLVVKASGRLFYYCVYYGEIKGWIVTEKFVHKNELWLILYFFDIIQNVFTLRSLYKILRVICIVFVYSYAVHSIYRDSNERKYLRNEKVQ